LFNRPEFRVKNKLIALKETDVLLLNEALKSAEEEQIKATAQVK